MMACERAIPSHTRNSRYGSTEPSDGRQANGRNRRVSPIASGRGDGLLPDHRAGAQPQRQELVFMVESERGAVTLGRACVFPPLSFDGALVARPWLRFHVPLIEPDMQIYRIRLSDKTSRLRVRRPLQFLNTLRSC